MAREITNYYCLDVSKLSKWGYLKPSPGTAYKSGVVTWTRDGEVAAQIAISVRIDETEQNVRVAYLYGGQKKIYHIELIYTPSNLPDHEGAGYYYFLCPATGKRCRKLYLVDGYFVSRRAFRPLYPDQLLSRSARASLYYFDQWQKIDELEGARKWRKTHYRGEPTPYSRKLTKLYHRV